MRRYWCRVARAGGVCVGVRVPNSEVVPARLPQEAESVGTTNGIAHAPGNGGGSACNPRLAVSSSLRSNSGEILETSRPTASAKAAFSSPFTSRFDPELLEAPFRLLLEPLPRVLDPIRSLTERPRLVVNFDSDLGFHATKQATPPSEPLQGSDRLRRLRTAPRAIDAPEKTRGVPGRALGERVSRGRAATARRFAKLSLCRSWSQKARCSKSRLQCRGSRKR